MDRTHHLPTQISHEAWRPDPHAGKDRGLGRSRHDLSHPNATPYEVEETVEMLRLNLYNRLLPHGPAAIWREMEDLAVRPLPSEAKIARILSRRGLTDPDHYAPRCNDYPEPVAARPGDVHETGFVGPFYLQGTEGARFWCLNSVDVATGRCAVEPLMTRGGQNMMDAIWAIWDRLGIPHHEKLSNEPAFYGTSHHPRSMGKLIRLCLANQVEPHFIPLGEAFRSPLVEDLHQAWLRWLAHNPNILSIEDLRRETRRVETHYIPPSPVPTPDNGFAAEPQTPPPPSFAPQTTHRASFRFPASPQPPRAPLPKPASGRYHIIRYVDRDALFDLFGETFSLPPAATFSYVKATVDRLHETLFFYLDDTLIHEHDYALP